MRASARSSRTDNERRAPGVLTAIQKSRPHVCLWPILLNGKRGLEAPLCVMTFHYNALGNCDGRQRITERTATPTALAESPSPLGSQPWANSMFRSRVRLRLQRGRCTGLKADRQTGGRIRPGR